MEQQTQQTEQTALDIAALKERCMGNLALVERVLAKVAGQLDTDLNALERAIETHNAKQAAKVVHRIKGTAGSVSARHLYLNAALAEQRAQDQPLDDLTTDLARMRNDRLEIVEVIERLKISDI
jgi:HPt (histidine-containing phosphotransfer) domain-containing protein